MSRLVKSYLIAHELFHAFQRDLLDTGAIGPASGPSWLIEGSAEYAAFRFVASTGLGDYPTLKKAQERYLARDQASRLASGSVESAADYALAFLATDVLMDGASLRVLADFFVDAGTMNWHGAFRKNFGQDVESFIDKFEAARR